jgi:hypothetical protein
VDHDDDGSAGVGSDRDVGPWTVGQRVRVDINGATYAATIEAVAAAQPAAPATRPLPPRRPPRPPPRPPPPLSPPPASPAPCGAEAAAEAAAAAAAAAVAVGPANAARTPTGSSEETAWSYLSPACYSEWVRDRGGLRARGEDEDKKDVVYVVVSMVLVPLCVCVCVLPFPTPFFCFLSRAFLLLHGLPAHRYYLGIIDILQEFNMSKRLESAYKQRLQILAGKDPSLISAVDASVYSKRFVDFMTDHLE